MKALAFHVVIEPDQFDDGRPAFQAHCPALNGCHTWGYTYEEALANIREAVELCVEEMRERGQNPPLSPDILEIESPAVIVDLDETRGSLIGKPGLGAQDHSIALEFKHALARSGVTALSTIVYGSRARGEATPDSDLDVLVVVEKMTPAIRDVVEECAYDVGLDNRIYLHPMAMERREYEEKPQRVSSFLRFVRAEGIPI